jgi:aerobic carbon-monoxide dehydrogenase medium subunit
MLALDAHVRLASAKGTRMVSAADFFTGLFSTAIEPGELLTEIVIPARAARAPALRGHWRTGFAFEEISRRRGDFALVGVAAAVSVDEGGRCVGARLALLSVGDRPILADRAPRTLIGQAPSAEAINAAAEVTAAEDVDPPSDIHASAKYRRQLAKVLTRRCLARAFSRCQ